MDNKSFRQGSSALIQDLVGALRTASFGKVLLAVGAVAGAQAAATYMGLGSATGSLMQMGGFVAGHLPAAKSFLVEASQWGPAASLPVVNAIFAGAYATIALLASQGAVSMYDHFRVGTYTEAYSGRTGLRQPVKGGAEVSPLLGDPNITNDEKAALEKIWSEFHGGSELAETQQLIDKCQRRMEVMSAQGDQSAQYDLGRNLLLEATAQSLAEAKPLLESATIKGNAGAAYYLSKMHYEGLGVEVDQAKGLALLEMACERREPLALLKIAQMYETGEGGVELDLASAERCLERAANLGCVSSLANLSQVREAMNSQGVASESVSHLSRQAEKNGDPDAHFKLGMLHYSGVQVEKNQAKAIQHMQKASAMAHPAAQNVYGQMLLAGETGQQDIKNGLFMLKSSASSFNPSARAKLAQLYDEVDYVRIDAGLAGKYKTGGLTRVDAERAEEYRQDTAGAKGLVDVMPKEVDQKDVSSMAAFDAFYASNGYASGALNQQEIIHSADPKPKPDGFKFG